MALIKDQFAHPGLYKLYMQGAVVAGIAIPASEQARCQRLLDMLEAMTDPDDLDLPGNNFSSSRNHYQVTVTGDSVITFSWRGGKAMDINYG